MRDLDEFLTGLENGMHSRIIDQLGSTIRNELGSGTRYVSTTVDGALRNVGYEP